MVGVGVAGGLDGGAALLCEGEERLRGFLGDEGQVDVFADEGPLVGAAEQEQRLGEVDRPGVDEVEALDELAVVAARIVAGDVEQGLRDRQRGAQLVGGVGGEPLLFGDVCFEPREHGVEGVGELAELVAAALELDPVGERSGRGQACGVRDARQRGEHLAGEQPPSQQAEHEQERQHEGRLRNEGVAGGRSGWDRELGMRGRHRTVGHVAQEEHPHDGEQQGAGDHEEPGVAEGELEANAQARGSIHGLLPRARCLVACRCGSRRRRRWR